jgi:L-asparaginase
MSPASSHHYDAGNRGSGVLVVYTGGTIGSMPRDPQDPKSPLVVVDWAEFRRRTSSLSPQLADGSANPRYIGFNVDGASLEPLDSCNIGPGYWVELARIIDESYDRYEGFVVLHGTDTMVYTASALSFMLEGLGKPVVLTGAQRSHLANVRNDALQNLLTALLIANPKHSGLPVVPEVSIFFHEELLRGNRSRKVNASGFAAFKSPNYPPLAAAGESIIVDRRVLRPPGSGLHLRSHIEPNVASVIFFPGIQEASILQDVLSDPRLKGVVLMTYGAGTVPSDSRVLDPIAAAVRRGVVAIAVTQCGGGRVELERYEASEHLLDAGVVSGRDITPEAALVKLMVLLGDPELTPPDVRRLLSQDLAGELTAG